MLIRFANREDYEEEDRIAEQVQKMHVEWRPDIYTFEKKIFPISIICSIVVLNFFVAVQLHKNSEIGKYVPFSQLDFLRNNLTNDYMFKRDISKPVFVVRPNGENLKIGKVIMLPSIAPYFDDNQKYIFINLHITIDMTFGGNKEKYQLV